MESLVCWKYDERLRKEIWPEFPAANVFGLIAKNNLKKAKKETFENFYLIGKELKKLGITYNCAPVLDLLVKNSNAVIFSELNSYRIMNSSSLVFFESSISKIESINAATSGFLGGANLPIIFSWFVGAILCALVAFVVGKVCLGLRSDYLAISTLLVSGIIITIVKHEEWLSRGVKNVIGLKRPVPYEVDLQNSEWFIKLVEFFNSSKLSNILDLDEKISLLNQLVITSSGVFVKLCFSLIFLVVVITILYFSEKALNSPWGRMMRAIRDNEEAAKAMGKNVVKQHLFIFMLGSAIIGFAGAMLVTYDGLFTPSSYQPLRYTFLIWVMVLLGGTGNNYGAILGGFVVWFIWIQSAPFALLVINIFTNHFDETNYIKDHLLNSVPYFRYLMMGLGLLLVMRYRPRGLLPEKIIKN